jgi:hypothetical protein
MYHKRRRKGDPRRNLLRTLRQPRSLKNSGGQNLPHRFLLANSLERCGRTSQTLQRVSNVREASSHTSSRTNFHPSCLAICMLGPRPSRSTQKGQRWFWILRRNRQIHQVDQVQAARKIQCSKSSRVHPRHHAPFWNTQPNHHRLGFPFYRYQI